MPRERVDDRPVCIVCGEWGVNLVYTHSIVGSGSVHLGECVEKFSKKTKRAMRRRARAERKGK